MRLSIFPLLPGNGDDVKVVVNTARGPCAPSS